MRTTYDHRWQPMKIQSLLTFSLLCIILVFGAWLRYPRIGEGLPFFYREDEAHHFNRLLDMAKSGDLNPHYFHKPSLHFYLRLPVVAAGFLWGVREGHIRSIQEVTTRDPFGVADYAFSTSHPGIVKWNRAFSVVLSLLLVVLSFAITRMLTSSSSASIASAFLVALSPALVEDSAVIGVDIIMSFFCLATTACAVWYSRSSAISALLYAGLLAGLAISSKYNALPIALVPLLCVAVWAPCSPNAWVIAAIAPIIGFFAGSPYILSSLPLFLDQFAYEVWHYGIAAHEGHSAEPGLPQALFYLEWLHRDGLGVVASAFGIVGIVPLLLRHSKRHAIFLVFPLAFAALMIFQRTNFTRNMLVIIPYVAISACVALNLVLATVRARESIRAAIFSCFIFAAALLPLQNVLQARGESILTTDSRLTIQEWLRSIGARHESTAIAGQLQFPATAYSLPGVSRFDLNKLDVLSLWQAGYNRIVVPKSFQFPEADQILVTPERSILGSNESLRIVQDPSMSTYQVSNSEKVIARIESGTDFSRPLPVTLSGDTSGKWRLECLNRGADEEHCWLTTRVSYLKIAAPDPASSLAMVVQFQSPWEQEMVLQVGSWKRKVGLTPGIWTEVAIDPPISELAAYHDVVQVYCPKVSSPKEMGLNGDSRRLGVALRLSEEKVSP